MRRWIVSGIVLLLSTILTAQQPALTRAQIAR